MKPDRFISLVLQQQRPNNWSASVGKVHRNSNGGDKMRAEMDIKEVVEEAWKHEPLARPSFDQLIEMCSQLRQRNPILNAPEGASRVLGGEIFVVVSTSAKSLQEENIMAYVEAVAKVRDDMAFGYDWKGSSSAEATRDKGVDWTNPVSIGESLWFKGYCERIKAEVLVLAQFGQKVVLVCIEGGMISQLEATTMRRLRAEIEADLSKKGISCNVAVEEISFHNFKQRFRPAAAGFDEV
jgi:hypothetical protein